MSLKNKAGIGALVGAGVVVWIVLAVASIALPIVIIVLTLRLLGVL